MADAPSPQFQIDRILNETTVEHVELHDELISTNNLAMELAGRSDLPRPILVLAKTQTGGRGRGKNQWWSTGGSLTFSLLTNLGNLPGDRIPQLSLTVGLAICEAIESVAPLADVALKWPNDVYLAGKKVAGVLIELPTNPPPQAIIGIGLNVNNSFTTAPEELQQTATSLCDAVELELDINEVLIACLQQLARHIDLFRQPTASLADQWRAYHLLQGMEIELEVYSKTVTGTCVGIDDDGALLLETEEGTSRFLGGVIQRFESR